jgi:hypothetical protein
MWTEIEYKLVEIELTNVPTKLELILSVSDKANVLWCSSTWANLCLTITDFGTKLTATNSYNQTHKIWEWFVTMLMHPKFGNVSTYEQSDYQSTTKPWSRKRSAGGQWKGADGGRSAGEDMAHVADGWRGLKGLGTYGCGHISTSKSSENPTRGVETGGLGD